MITMLTLQNRSARLRLGLRGTSHGQQARLSAATETFGDKINIQFDIGSQVPGRARSVRLKESDSQDKPGFTAVKGVVHNQAERYPVGVWVAPPADDGSRSYEGQVDDDQLSLRQTPLAEDWHKVEGRVGQEWVDFTVRVNRSYVDVSGSTGRHTMNLQGYEEGGTTEIPLSGIITSVAASSYIDRYR
jgi:hypothetical protein